MTTLKVAEKKRGGKDSPLIAKILIVMLTEWPSVREVGIPRGTKRS